MFFLWLLDFFPFFFTFSFYAETQTPPEWEEEEEPFLFWFRFATLRAEKSSCSDAALPFSLVCPGQL